MHDYFRDPALQGAAEVIERDAREPATQGAYAPMTLIVITHLASYPRFMHIHPPAELESAP